MKSKSFRYLWLGQLLANFGDVFYIVGCISILYGFTSSAFYLVLLPFLNTIGRFICSLLSPILFNKYRLKTLLVGSQTVKTIFLFGLSCFVSFQKEQGIWLVLFLIFLIAFFDGWALPATNAMLPRLVKKEVLVKANSFVAVMNQTTQLSGWALGSMLVAFLTGKNVIWLTFVLFVFSTFMMKGIIDNTPFQPAESREKKTEAMKEGWLIIWNKPLYRIIHVQIMFEAIAGVVWVAAILYVFVKEIFHVSEAWWGYINTIYFIGLIVETSLADPIRNRFRKGVPVAGFSAGALISLDPCIISPKDNIERVFQVRPGLGFVTDVQIAVHFSEWDDKDHLYEVAKRYPDKENYSIDENTGLYLKNGQVERMEDKGVFRIIGGELVKCL